MHDLNSPKEYLSIGDLITLKCDQSYLSAEGILFDDVVVNDASQNFDDSLFCVHFQRQYSAARELDHFLNTYNIDDVNSVDENTIKYLKALEVSQILHTHCHNVDV